MDVTAAIVVIDAAVAADTVASLLKPAIRPVFFCLIRQITDPKNSLAFYSSGMKKHIPQFFLCLSLPSMCFQPVNINHASAEQIEVLPGVGKNLANSIVKYRSQKGLFHSSQDLSNVSGMTEKKRALIEKNIIFGPPLKLPKKSPSLKEAEPPALLSRPKKTMIGLPQLEDKVLRVAGLERDFEEKIARRARVSAWLPKITLEGDVDRHSSATELVSSSRDGSSQRSGNVYGIGVKVSFDLPQVLFHNSELDITKLALKQFEAREKLIAQLHTYYFEYARLNQEITIPSPMERIEHLEGELNSYAAKLDFLSDGDFSRFQKESAS